MPPPQNSSGIHSQLLWPRGFVGFTRACCVFVALGIKAIVDDHKTITSDEYRIDVFFEQSLKDSARDKAFTGSINARNADQYTSAGITLSPAVQNPANCGINIWFCCRHAIKKPRIRGEIPTQKYFLIGNIVWRKRFSLYSDE